MDSNIHWVNSQRNLTAMLSCTQEGQVIIIILSSFSYGPQRCKQVDGAVKGAVVLRLVLTVSFTAVRLFPV